MKPDRIRLSTASTKKVDEILRRAKYELGMILVKSFLMSAGSVIPIAIISSTFGLILTPFPFVAGLATAMMIQFKYVVPRSREVGERHGKKLQEVIEEERKRQAAQPEEG